MIEASERKLEQALNPSQREAVEQQFRQRSEQAFGAVQ